MGVPKKNNPNSPEYATQLETLNHFTDFLLNLDPSPSTKLKEDALKVIECLKFIKLNAEYIGYAVEHREDPDLYTYSTDNAKGVIRDFNNTAMHFNSYHSKEQVKTGLENLVKQFENAITAMQEKEKLLAFAQKLQFDGDIGCIEERTANALSFAATTLSSSSQNLDELMEKCQFTAEDDEDVMLGKTKNFFEPYIGQTCIWNNQEHVINHSLIKRYLTEVFGVEFPISEKLLDALEDKSASQYCLELIEKVDSSELEQALLTQDRGFKTLQSIILHQPPNVCLAFINKLSSKTINTLFHECNSLEKMQCLKSALQIQSLEVCLALLEKMDEIENVKFTFKDKLSIFWKHFCNHIKKTDSFRTSTLFKLIAYTIAIILIVMFPQISLMITLIIALVSLCIVPILLLIDCIKFSISIVEDFFKSLNSAKILTNIESNFNDYLLNDLLTFQSPKLLAAFLNKLSPQQLKQITLPLELLKEKKSLLNFLFAPDCEHSSESMDAYYAYLCANKSLKSDLLANRHFLMTSCIDYFFEGKPGKLHPKLIQLFEECLHKKQHLSEKEQAFLEALKKETISSPEITAKEVWCAGVDSWSHYRYLRQKNDPAMQAVLDELLLVDRLFQGDTRTFHENRNDEFANEKQDFEEAHTCIRTNKGLAKTIQSNNYPAFMQQLENLNHRPRLRQTVDGANKKFVHLTGEIVDYQKKRQQKVTHTHTKKTSTTLVSEQLNTPLFNEAPGFLFHQDQCKVKARMLQTSRTFSHEWLGGEAKVNQYKTTMQRINETDEKKFVEKIKNGGITNEVLAKLNKDALQAVIVTQDTPETLRLATSRRNELRDKFSLNLPIIFYNASQRSIAYYRLKEMNSLAKKLMLNVYRFCLEKQDWKPGFFANNAPTENKLTPKTVSFIKKLVEDAQQKEQANNSANDTIWLDVKNKVETKLNSVCHSASVSQFFRGRSANTQNFYHDIKNFMNNQTNNDNWSAPIKPAI
ncbi:hypothetical protein [Rickettsiella endosymbiont of Miltochrista miniata]|uniref:hypothetical protein n=1 Tax=Rickettsiella endosymbiont of Miltochrista miniata TaxID=3066239 RepID=UPI00313E21D9